MFATKSVETTRLLLRMPQLPDAEALMGILWDPEIVEQKQVTLHQPPGDLDLALKNTSDMLRQWELRGYGQWSVVEKATGRVAESAVSVSIIRSGHPHSESRLGHSPLAMGPRLCDRGGGSGTRMGLGTDPDRQCHQPDCTRRSSMDSRRHQDRRTLRASRRGSHARRAGARVHDGSALSSYGY